MIFKNKILPWKTPKQNFVAFFFLLGMAFSFISGRHIVTPYAVMRARNILGYSKRGNQSERAKSTIYWFGIC